MTVQSPVARVLERPASMLAYDPVAPREPRRWSWDVPAPRGRMNATVLVVEDDRNIGDLLRTHLERDGYRVRWVRSGEAGIEEIERHPVDLAILDTRGQRRRRGHGILDHTAAGRRPANAAARDHRAAHP